MKKYKITNISGYLPLLGLYPGKSKTVNDISNKEIKKLLDKGLIFIKEEKVKEKIEIITEKDEVN